MAISSRKEERAAILATFTQYFTPETDDDLKLFEGIADKIFKQTFDLLQQRELWVLLYQPAPGLPMAMTGPFSSQKDAEKGAELLVGGAAQAVKVIPFAAFKAQSETDAEAFNALFGARECAECGHQEFMHGSMGFKKGGGLGPVTPPAKNRCAINCTCKGYKEPE